MANNDNKENKRRTLSLKSTVGVGAPKSSSGNKTIEVEIKRKKSGLTVDLGEKSDLISTKVPMDSQDQLHFGQTGNLTDKEFETRVKALQEAIKDEEIIRQKEVFNELKAKSAETDMTNDTGELEQSEKIEEIENSDEIIAEQEKKSKRQEPKRRDTFVLNTNPIVFRASDYQKKAVAPKKLEPVQTVKSETKPANITDIPIQEKASSYKPKEKVVDESDSPKKMKIVVKAKTSDRRSQTAGKVSRAVLDRVMNNDSEERARSIASLKRARQKLKNSPKDQETVKVVREVDIPDMITVGELANRMAVRSAEVVKYLMSIGTMATINQPIDGDTAEVICTEFGHKPKRISESDIENELENIIDDPKDLTPRAPIVAVMGHVDHGKTTLLDTLRKTSVAQKEAGGITQHVAAYQIETKEGKKITFIDTPGHAAFSKIRARGAVITDIIVLVVAADDGIKEQSIEVINQAKAQNVPIVVAINKIDKPNINIDKVKTELMTQEIVLEDFGGETLSAEISAKQNINLDGLIETILLQAEILELKANKDRSPVGTVLESRVDKGKGVIASVIVQHGTIKSGDIFVAGGVFGKVRTIYDDKGKRLVSAGPATPIEIVGFDSTPEPGDILTVVDSEQKAREIAEYRKRSSKSKSSKFATKTMDQMMSGEKSIAKTLNILVKADVYGSLEAVVASLESIYHPEIKVISESDIDFAKTTEAIVIGFNVNTSAAAKESAKFYDIKVLNHNIIYHMTEEVKSIMGTMLAPIVEENYIGNADVRKIFTISRFGTIAGCYVTDGIIKKASSKIKIMRAGNCVFEGKIRSMRHEKDEIKESRQSHECGILAEGYNDFKEGDQIECYEIVLKSRSVD